MKYILDKYFEKTKGFYPFFKYCPDKYKIHYINRRASETLGYEYNYLNPRTFNEKIRWLIYNENLELKTKLTDKILVKGYIASKIGENHTAELYGVYDDFKEIDFSILPDKFALKANHGWRMNVIVKNKNFIYKNYEDLSKITKKWLKTDYEEFSVEPQYHNIKRKLFIEYLRNGDNKNNRNDIQIYCFNGKPLYCELKNYLNDSVYYQVYDIKWNLQDFNFSGFYMNQSAAKPEKFEEILEYARILSKDFSFVRIDFAYDNNNIHIVEMTFTPCSAIIPFHNQKTDFILGGMLELPTARR